MNRCFSTLMSVEMSGGRLLSVKHYLTEDNGLRAHIVAVLVSAFPSAVSNTR